MMAQQFPAHGMGGPGLQGMPHGHPMGVPHPGAGHMGGQPNPAMMQGMHPGVAGPQVSQGPMVTGMPPGAGTPAPMQQNGMAMAHLGPQQHMFPGHNQQMSLDQMRQMNQHLARQRMMMSHQGGMPMNAMNPQFQQQIAQMKMGMPMQQQQQQHMQNMQNMQSIQQQQQQQFQQQQQQQQQHQARLMAAQHAAQQQALRAQSQQQQAAAQQMQMSRSQEQTSQPPQPVPTPAPTNQPPQPQPQPSVQAQQPTVQQPPKPQPTPQPAPQQSTPAPSVKADGEGEEPQIKQQEGTNQMMIQDIPKQQQNDFTGQCILQLLLYQDKLANPERATDLAYWEETIQKYFSPYGSIRQQLFNNKLGNDKSFQLQYPSLARFFYTHFTNGIKQILMQSFDHNQRKMPNGEIHIWSNRASLTYVFHNDLRITTQGSLRVNFDDMQKIEHLFIATTGWTEYIPRHALQPASPNQTTSPKLTNKNPKKPQKAPSAALVIPSSGVSDFGLPPAILQFLEITEVMTAMGPLMEFFHSHPGISPREALRRISSEGPQVNNNMMRMQNAAMMAPNGQMGFPQQRMGMNMPSQLQSPALQHLGLPHGQGSPGMSSNHTGSPAQTQGGIAMMHQMSAQGSNLSGSHGPSTNTSPNVSNKRRRASNVKMEDENNPQDPSGGDKVKPSPRMGGKRQKGQT